MPIIKICGLSTKEAVEASIKHDANLLGFIFFPKSPRNVAPEQAAALTASTPRSIKSVAVMVNPSDDDLSGILSKYTPDYIQLHGIESPNRVADIRKRWSIPVIKAIPVASPEDIKLAPKYNKLVDMIIFDAKTPKDTLPGGMGLRFDWSLLEDLSIETPWLLSGGLNPENIHEALEITQAPGVDVSSGVETSPGEKSADLIKAFIQAARQ